MKSFRSFAKRLSMNILLIVSILFVVSLVIVAFSSHYLMSEEAEKTSSYVLQSTILDVEKDIQSVESSILSMSWVVEENRTDEDYMYHIVRKIVDENDIIVGCAIAFDSCCFEGRHYFAPYCYRDEDSSRIVSMQLGTEQNNYFTQEWFDVPHVTGKDHWSEPYFDEGGGKIMMTTFSHPLKDNSGKVYAIFTADISLEQISKKVSSIHPYEHSHSTLVSAQGHYLSEGWEAGLREETVFTTAEKVDDPRVMEISNSMMAGDSGTMRYSNKGQVGFAVYGPLSNGWSMAITCEYRDVLERTSKMHMILIIVGIIGLLVMFIICYKRISQLTQPITEFSVSASNMAKGNFHAIIPEVKSNDEIKRLSKSLLWMQDSINKYIAKLSKTTTANERMESELSIAQKIQAGMLPRNFPEDSRCDIYAYLEPAREVGGDLYDFLVKDDEYLRFAIGDVSGKGVPAALVMAITCATCRFFSGLGLPMNELVIRLNHFLSQSNDYNMFVTFFMGRINLETKTFEYCNAGHNPLVVIPPSPNEKPYYLKAQTNIALGVFDGFEYKMETLALAPGTKLLLYTDGVTEAENISKEQFGEERLLEILSMPEIRNMKSKEIIETVCNEMHKFTGGNEQNDDITILAISI